MIHFNLSFFKSLSLVGLMLLSLNAYAVDPRGEKAYEAAMKAYNAKEYQNAVYAFENSITFNPHLYKSYCMLGLAYLLNDEPLKAENVYLKAIEEFPLEWKAYVLLADFYATQEKYQQSVSYYQQALSLSSFPAKEKRKYQDILDGVEAKRREKWAVSETERENILMAVDTPLDMSKFRASIVERQENGSMHIVYSLKSDDYRANKWKQVLDLTCTEPLMGNSNTFEELNEYISASYRKIDADIDTIERGDVTRLFEAYIRKPKTEIIGYIYPVRDRFCVAQFMMRPQMTSKDREDWKLGVRSINIRHF